MSKLADLIQRTTRVEGRALGFAASTRKAPAGTLLLVALVSERWAQGTTEAQGADAVFLTSRPSEKDVADAVAAANDKPVGVLASDVDSDRVAKLRDAGVDFVALDTDTSANALAPEDIGFVLHLREDLSDMHLRALESLPLDALYLESGSPALTIARQIELRRVSGLARKPLLLPVRPDAQQDDLIALRESGVTLLGIDMQERGAAETLSRLRGVIEALPQRRTPRERPSEALLPRAAVASSDEDEDED